MFRLSLVSGLNKSVQWAVCIPLTWIRRWPVILPLYCGTFYRKNTRKIKTFRDNALLVEAWLVTKSIRTRVNGYNGLTPKRNWHVTRMCNVTSHHQLVCERLLNFFCPCSVYVCHSECCFWIHLKGTRATGWTNNKRKCGQYGRHSTHFVMTRWISRENVPKDRCKRRVL